ncbi:LAGLIDADG family homing endonuclease [Candidatus Omnitrophota bacterium]
MQVQLLSRAPWFIMKLNIDSNFFKNWSPDMAYILGLIATDGCLIQRKNATPCVDITNNEIDLLNKIKQTMKSEHKICKKKRGARFQVRNRVIYFDLLKLGLTPRKSKSLKFPEIPFKYLADFIRGCFDGDGGVTIWKEQRWKQTWQIRITFCSGSRSFLEELHRGLILHGELKKGKIWNSGRAYELHFGIADSLRFYRFMYSKETDLYLKRKKDTFEKFIKLRNAQN